MCAALARLNLEENLNVLPRVVDKSQRFVWLCRAIRAPFVICDIKATLFFVNFGKRHWSLAASLATGSETRCQAPSGFIWDSWTRKAGRWSGCKALFPLNGGEEAGGRARGKEGGGDRGGGRLIKAGLFFFFFKWSRWTSQLFWLDGQNHFNALNLKISRPSLLFFLQE